MTCHWLDEEDGGEELIRFDVPAQARHYGQVRGVSSLQSRYTNWVVTALGVAEYPKSDGLRFYEERLELIRGVMPIVTVSCSELENVPVWPTLLFVPRRLNLSFMIPYGPRTSSFVLRFAWKRHVP